jgi:hypothetical protein
MLKNTLEKKGIISVYAIEPPCFDFRKGGIPSETGQAIGMVVGV